MTMLENTDLTVMSSTCSRILRDVRLLSVMFLSTNYENMPVHVTASHVTDPAILPTLSNYHNNV